VEAVHRVRKLRDFDRLTVVPRFGFTDPEDYYRRAGVGACLHRLAVPALLVACPGDPMVASGAITAAAAASPALDLRWVRGGGHMGFPPGVDLGESAPRGLETQLAAWLARRGGDAVVPLEPSCAKPAVRAEGPGASSSP
jgi:predicted alpha/beta-fold hydrolase